MHKLRQVLLGTGFALGMLCSAGAKELPTGDKFQKILGLLQKESVVSVPSGKLLDSAVRELEQASGVAPGSGSSAQRLEQFCQKNPALCEDGTVLKHLLRGAGKALNDPYLTYLNPQAYQGVSSRFQGQAQAQPRFSVVKDAGQPLKVLEVMAGGPTGLRAGDLVLSVDGAATVPMAVEEGRARLMGAEGSSLLLEVQHRDGSRQQLQATRCAPQTGTVESALHTYSGKKVGYLRIRNFAATTPDETRAALANLRQQGAGGLVIDLRNNGGGLVNSAVEVCSQLLPAGTDVVSVQRRKGLEVRKAHAAAQAVGAPQIVVLVNQESASAAEIMAAALHDARVATLVGSRSFGKGTVQRYAALGDGSALKFTTAHYLTPKGISINGTGIEPDVIADDTHALERGIELLAR